MPNGGIIRSGPILWPDAEAPEVMSSWMKRIARHDRKDTETLQFAFLHSPDGHPVCGVVPLIVGQTEEAGKGTCDEIAAYAGGAVARQDTQLPYTAIQAALDECFPYDTNYWDKGVFIDWDPERRRMRSGTSSTRSSTPGPHKPAFAIEGVDVHPPDGGRRRGREGRPGVHLVLGARRTIVGNRHHRMAQRRRSPTDGEQEVVR